MALKTFTTADGSANQALVTNGSGVLSFAAVGASAGQVIQVITATDSTRRNTTTTNTFLTASNTLSVSITPSSASNKIFIIVNTGAYIGAAGSGSVVGTIYRDATNLGLASASDGLSVGARGEDGASAGGGSLAMSYLDSPSTTSATTYQVYFKSTGGAGVSATINDAGNNTDSVTGSITCFEIKG